VLEGASILTPILNFIQVLQKQVAIVFYFCSLSAALECVDMKEKVECVRFV